MALDLDRRRRESPGREVRVVERGEGLGHDRRSVHGRTEEAEVPGIARMLPPAPEHARHVVEELLRGTRLREVVSAQVAPDLLGVARRRGAPRRGGRGMRRCAGLEAPWTSRPPSRRCPRSPRRLGTSYRAFVGRVLSRMERLERSALPRGAAGCPSTPIERESNEAFNLSPATTTDSRGCALRRRGPSLLNSSLPLRAIASGGRVVQRPRGQPG